MNSFSEKGSFFANAPLSILQTSREHVFLDSFARAVCCTEPFAQFCLGPDANGGDAEIVPVVLYF